MGETVEKKSDLKSAASRVLGVYPQKQRGLFMQRIKVFGGRINWRQWRRVSELASIYGAGSAVHITTRQDIELHNIAGGDISAVQQGLCEVGLRTFGACGDSVRNMTLCAGCDLSREGYDLMGLAQVVRTYLEQSPVILNLPRKFKISFSGCTNACAKPWLNDLGFVAQRNGLFTAIGAGSLGPKPGLGIELYRDLSAGEVLPLCVAAIEFFEERGERKNRRRARLRHIREKVGDESFRRELEARFVRVKKRQNWSVVLPARGDSKKKLLCRLQLRNGNISPEEAIVLAEAGEAQEAILRINLEHGLELYGTEMIELGEGLSALCGNAIIIACPGSTTCPHGLCDCWATADSIRGALEGMELGQLRINISGCPNNCAHSSVADIGLVGLMRKEKAESVACYRLFRDGGNGRSDKLAEQQGIMRAADAAETIKRLLGGDKMGGA